MDESKCLAAWPIDTLKNTRSRFKPISSEDVILSGAKNLASGTRSFGRKASLRMTAAGYETASNQFSMDVPRRAGLIMYRLELRVPPPVVALCLALLMWFAPSLCHPELPLQVRVGMALVLVLVGQSISIAGMVA